MKRLSSNYKSQAEAGKVCDVYSNMYSATLLKSNKIFFLVSHYSVCLFIWAETLS